MYKKIFCFVITIIFVLSLTTTILAEGNNNHRLGVKQDPVKPLEFSTNKVKSTLPQVIDHKDKIPNVGNQGSQGSCVGWATAYLKSYYDGLEINKIIEFSPSFIYNQINGGNDLGSRPSDAMDLLINKGICTMDKMPYNELDYLFQPSISALQQAKYFKANQYRYGYIDSWTGIAYIKNYLQNNTMLMTIPVYPDFDNIWEGNPVYNHTSGVSRGYHAITIIGYDDNLNAFKFINSWGNNWGLDGYGYISYNLVKNNINISCYIINDKVNQDPDMTLYVNNTKCNSKIEQNKMTTWIRNITNNLNGTVNILWDDATKTITIDNGNIINLTIGSSIMLVNGVPQILENVPYIDNGQTIIQVREISEALDANVEWIPDFKYVDVAN